MNLSIIMSIQEKDMLHIITDSSAELSEEEATALSVEVIPLTIVFDKQAYLEGAELSKDEFYQRLISGEFPRTSQPSLTQFAEAFARTKGEETLVLLISSALSGTTNAARLAKEDGNFTQVHIYETLCTTAMLRFLVEAAAANREKSAEEVIAILNDLRPRLRLYACLDTLEYLQKGGRIKKSVAFVGNLLGIKPIIELTSEGTVGMTGKARGQKKALLEISEQFRKEPLDPGYPVYYLQTDKDFPPRTLMELTGHEGKILRICCAVGTHIGPNAAGIVYVVKNNE